MIVEDNYHGIVCRVCKKEIKEDFVVIQHCQRMKQSQEISMIIEYCHDTCYDKTLKDD